MQQRLCYLVVLLLPCLKFWRKVQTIFAGIIGVTPYVFMQQRQARDIMGFLVMGIVGLGFGSSIEGIIGQIIGGSLGAVTGRISMFKRKQEQADTMANAATSILTGVILACCVFASQCKPSGFFRKFVKMDVKLPFVFLASFACAGGILGHITYEEHTEAAHHARSMKSKGELLTNKETK